VGNGSPTGGAEFDLQAPSMNTDCTQVCPEFYAIADGNLNGYFKFEINQLVELNSTGGPCCTVASPTCQVGGCNFHNFGFLPNFFNITIGTLSNKQVNYSAYVSNSAILGRPCTISDLGIVDICALVQINYQIYDKAGFYNIGGTNFSIKSNSLFGSVKVSGWTFAQGSTGLRFYLLFTERIATPVKYVLSPGNLVDPNPPITNIQSATLTDNRNKQGAIDFTSLVILNNAATATSAVLSGPYFMNSDPNGRFFALDVPVFNEVEIFFNAFIPSVSQGGGDVVGGVVRLSPVFMLFICVFFFLL